MTYPKIQFRSGNEVDYETYEHCQKEARLYFFQKKRYLVLPYIPKQKTIAGKTVYLPRGDFQKNSFTVRNIDISKYQTYVDSFFNSFGTDLYQIFGDKVLKKVRSLTIAVSNIGPGGYVTSQHGKQSEIALTIRRDIFPSQILSLILMWVISQTPTNIRCSWEEVTILREWLKDSTILKKYFKSKTSLFSNLKETNQQARYFEEAASYLAEIGLNTAPIPPKQKELEKVLNLLGKKEQKLLLLLLENNGHLVTYENIFKTLRGDSDSPFSLYAITKLVERLRAKIRKAGLVGIFIQSYKGSGYYISIDNNLQFNQNSI